MQGAGSIYFATLQGYVINETELYMYITILVKQVYWYISRVSGERLQDHWSSGCPSPTTLVVMAT